MTRINFYPCPPCYSWLTPFFTLQPYVVRRFSNRHRALRQRARRSGHSCEAFAERLALQVASVDALADDRQLVEREHLIERDGGHVAAAGACIRVDQVGAA